MNTEKLKQIALGGSTIALAIAMGLQSFVFGQNDIQLLKEQVAQISERLSQLEAPKMHE